MFWMSKKAPIQRLRVPECSLTELFETLEGCDEFHIMKLDKAYSVQAETTSGDVTLKAHSGTGHKTLAAAMHLCVERIKASYGYISIRPSDKMRV